MEGRDQIFNTLTMVMLALTAMTLICYIAIAINPYFPLNPFPPPTQVAQAISPTPKPTATQRNAPPTWTPTATPTNTPTPPATFSPTPTQVPSATPTDTPKPPTPTNTLTPSPTPRVTRSPHPFTYELTYETPYYGCEWTGVAGVVQDLDGNALEGYPVHIWGGPLDVVVHSGSKQMYGDSGWEQFINNQPMEMRGIFRVQLHSPEDSTPISEEIILDFEGYCSGAMAFIVFIKNH